MRSISSQVFQPTSPTQISLVPGPEREPERVAQAVRDDPARVGVGAADERVAGSAGAGVRVDAQDRAVEAGGSPLVRRSWLRSAPPSAVGGVMRAADAARRVAARVERVAVLAVVGEVEARAVARADVERAVGAEGELADRVARVLLAPVLDQHLSPSPFASQRARGGPLTTQPSPVGARRRRAGVAASAASPARCDAEARRRSV